MNSGDSSSQNKRKERVKSIFDSDDSDEDNEKAFGHSPSNDEDEDDDLRKQIDEVCFNLSNEEEKMELGNVSDKRPELNIPMPTFTIYEVTGSNQNLIPKVDTKRDELNIFDKEKKLTDPVDLKEEDNVHDISVRKGSQAATNEQEQEQECFEELKSDDDNDCLEIRRAKDEQHFGSFGGIKEEDAQVVSKEKIKESDDQTESFEYLKESNHIKSLEEQGNEEEDNLDVISGTNKEQETINESFEEEMKCSEDSTDKISEISDITKQEDDIKVYENICDENWKCQESVSRAPDSVTFEIDKDDNNAKEKSISQITNESKDEETFETMDSVIESVEDVEMNEKEKSYQPGFLENVSTQNEEMSDTDCSNSVEKDLSVDMEDMTESENINNSLETSILQDVEEHGNREDEDKHANEDLSPFEASTVEDDEHANDDQSPLESSTIKNDEHANKVPSPIELSTVNDEHANEDLSPIESSTVKDDECENNDLSPLQSSTMKDDEHANVDKIPLELSTMKNDLSPLQSSALKDDDHANEDESPIESSIVIDNEHAHENLKIPLKSPKIEDEEYIDNEEHISRKGMEDATKNLKECDVEDDMEKLPYKKIVREIPPSGVNKPFSFLCEEETCGSSNVQDNANSPRMGTTEHLSESTVTNSICETIDNQGFEEEMEVDKEFLFDKLKMKENDIEMIEEKSNDQIKQEPKESKLDLSVVKIPYLRHTSSPNNETEKKYISEESYGKGIEQIIVTKTEVDLDVKSIKENEDSATNEILERSSKDSLANLSDVWNTVNLFQTSNAKNVPLSNLNVSSSKADVSSEYRDSDSDSGTDVNDQVDSNVKVCQVESKPIEVQEDVEEVELAGPAQTIKDNTSSPWEAMKNGSLFEDIQVLRGQSPEYQNAESLKRKKVRVEDVFTDSEGDESPRKFQKVANGNEGVQDKTQNEAAVKKVRHKRVRATSINLPAIMLAFEKGWIREVVYRSSSGIANKRADVYYYSPSMRKLRSRAELEEYLQKNNITDLGLQNFSFFKEPLGVEEKYERIRHASNLVKLGDSSALSVAGEDVTPLPKKRARKPTTKVKEASPTKKAKAKDVVKKVLIKEATSKNVSSAVKRKTSNAASTTNTTTTTTVIATRPTYQVPNSDTPVYATHLYPANPPLTYARIITPIVRGEAKDKTFHCTPSCEAGGGNVPSLQCVKCVCLFHSECCQMPPQTVSLILSSMAKFLCPNCYGEENKTKNYIEEFKPSLCFEPLAFDPSSESEDEGLVSDFEHPLYRKVNARPRTPTLPPFSPLLESSKQFSTFRTPALNVPMLQQQSTCTPPAQQASLPQLIPNLPVAVPIPSTSSVGPTSFLIYQPINKNAMFQQPGIVSSPQISYKTSHQQQSGQPGTQPQLASPVQKAAPERIIEKPIIPQIAPGVRGGKYFLRDMSSAYQIMRKIFVYMSVPDLLTISRVCSMWRDLAMSPLYWNSVRLRNVCVKDWDKMVEFLDRRGTIELDLRKMVIYSGLVEEKMQSSEIEEFVTPNDENFIPTEEITEKEDFNDLVADKNSCEDEVNVKVKILPEEMDDSDVDMKDVEIGKEEFDDDVPMSSLENDLDVTKQENEEISPLKNDSNSEKGILETMDVVERIDEIEIKQEEEENKTEEEKQIEMEQLKIKEELERKEKEEREKMSYIVSSVLSEHDYFGRARTSSSSSGSSSSSNSSSSSDSGSGESSSDSSDSETQMDITEEEIERSLQKLEDKINIETPPEIVDEASKALQEPEADKFEGGTDEVVNAPLEAVTSPEKIINEKKAESKEEEVVQEHLTHANTEEIQPAHPPQEENLINQEWQIIGNALGKMKSLRKLMVGTSDSSVAELLLSTCHQLLSFSALNFDSQADIEGVRFDPSVLMQTRNLEELRLSAQKTFTFKSNFNFIKLPKLKILMLKGLKTTDMGWPYLGINLTHLYLSSISTFSHNNWLNVSAMTDLVELELDGSGSDHDTELCTALGKLTKLSRLTLLDWNIGSKLPHTLKRLHNIKFLHLIPAVENQSMRGIFAGRLMVILESAKHLEEFIWGIQPQNIIMDEVAGEKIFMLNMKAGKETGSVEGEEVRSVSIDSLKGFIKCRIPQTKISVKKVSSNIWTWTGVE